MPPRCDSHMPRLRLAQPLWLDHAPRAPILPALERTIHVDVAIVGGAHHRCFRRPALSRATGIAGVGAIKTRGNGQVDPYRACLGLARAARREGARLFEHSPVERIESGSQSVSVATRRVTARERRAIDRMSRGAGAFGPSAKVWLTSAITSTSSCRPWRPSRATMRGRGCLRRAGWTSLHWGASRVPEASLRSRVRWQRNDVRVPRRATFA